MSVKSGVSLWSVTALARANAGLRSKDMAKAQQDATDAQNAIKGTM
jgi:hypothetical protein